MPAPTLDRLGELAYFTDRAGNRWRVYDVSFGPPHAELGHWAIHPFGSLKAKQRVFIPRDSSAARHVYTFATGEGRELTDLRLDEQFRRSAVFYRDRLQNDNVDPR